MTSDFGLLARGDVPGLVVQRRPYIGAWKPVINLDLEEIDSVVDMSAAGSYELAGAEWWAKGSLWTLSGGVADTVPGAGGGIRLVAAAAVGADRPEWFNLAGFPRRLVFLPFSQFSSWRPDLPTWVVWRIVGDQNLSGVNTRSLVAGVGGLASSAAAISVAEKARAFAVLHYDTGPSTFLMTKGTSTLGWDAQVAAPGPNSGDYQFAFMRAVAGAYVVGVDGYTTQLDEPNQAFITSFTAVFNARPLYVQFNVAGSPIVEEPNFGFFFTMQKVFSDGVALDIRLNKLAVYQPG